MSRENVEVVRASWTAYAREDFDACLSMYADDTVWDDTRYRPDGAVHRGRDALVELVLAWRGAFDRYTVEVEEVVGCDGDRVAVAARETGRGRAGGVEMTNRWGVVATVRSGLIAHTTVYRTPEEAFQAAGLRD